MPAEKESISKIFQNLKRGLEESEREQVLSKLENVLLLEDQKNKKTLSLLEDEIAILKNLNRIEPDEAKFRVFHLEKQLSDLKKQLTQSQVELDYLKRKDLERSRTVEALEKENTEFSVLSASYKGRWVWDIEILAMKEAALIRELHKIEDQFEGLMRQSEVTRKSIIKKTDDEKQDLKTSLFKELYQALAHYKQSLIIEEQNLLKGLLNFVQNHVGGIRGSAKMIQERINFQLAGNKNGRIPKLKPISVDKLQNELDLLNNILKENSEKIKTLHDSLGQFSQLIIPAEIELEPLHLDAWLKDYAAARSESWSKKDCAVELQLAAAPYVHSNPKILSQSLDELVHNAFESAEAHSKISLGILHHKDDSWVGIFVRNIGAKIPSHLKEKIFYPFYSTKEGRLGLGLTRSSRLASFLGGTIILSPDKNFTEFIIKLPIIKNHPAKPV